MSNSALATEFYPAYTGNYTKGREGYQIKAVTIHHMAGKCSAAACGQLFQRVGRNGSSHYGIGYAGEIAQYVDESDTAWTNSNWISNLESVTIETSNISGSPDWLVSDESYASLVNLVADIAKRNNLYPLVKGQNLTWHSMFAATSCPGTYLLSKLDEIVEKANAIISGGSYVPVPKPIDNVNVYYSVYTTKWLDTVVNYNELDYNGYAGWDGKPITGIRCNLSNGSIVYRVHIKGGQWLDWVKDLDPTQGGYAGIYGKPIDGVQMYLEGLPNYHVEYRTRIKNGQYLSWIKNYGQGNNGYSGLWGNELDRIQIRIIKDYDIEDSEPTTVDEPTSTPVEEKPEEKPIEPVEETAPSNNDVQDNTQEQDNHPVEEPKPTYKSFDGLTLEEKIEEVKRYLAEYDTNTQQSTYSIDPKADINGDGKISALDLIELEKQYALENPTVETGETSIETETESTETTTEPVENNSTDETDNESIWVRLIKAIVNLFKAIFGKKKD